jgi:hypothetical protein
MFMEVSAIEKVLCQMLQDKAAECRKASTTFSQKDRQTREAELSSPTGNGLSDPNNGLRLRDIEQ